MHIRTFVRASDKQVEAAGGDAERAQKRMLDWHVVMNHLKGTRVALGDFAVVPGQKWKHAVSALSRGLDRDTALDGGEVGASVVQRAVTSWEVSSLRGIDLIRGLSNELLIACMESDPRGLPYDKEDARGMLAQDRQYAPTGYLAVADVSLDTQGTAEIDITQIGDVFVALDTGGRIPRVLEGSLHQQAYDGEIVLGEDKAVDVLKAELKTWISGKYPDISDQFFYDVIFNGKLRPQFVPGHVGALETFIGKIVAELRGYACTKYFASNGLTPAVFGRMIEKGMTPWQQNVAQNNPAAGPYWYPALDPVGDTPEHGISHMRLQLDNVLTGTPARLVLWTDGSAPTGTTGITMDNLKGLNAYGEQTRMEIELKQ